MAGDPKWLNHANMTAQRKLPLHPDLIRAMDFLPEMGVTMEVFSGGQPGRQARELPVAPRLGSRRHDDGKAADVFLHKDGRRLDWSRPDDLPIFSDIIRRAKARGVTGFGAGPGYMQPGSLHLGFGAPAIWGANGRHADAPHWLVEAFGAVSNDAQSGIAARQSSQNASSPPTPQIAGRGQSTAIATFPQQQQGTDLMANIATTLAASLLGKAGLDQLAPMAKPSAAAPTGGKGLAELSAQLQKMPGGNGGNAMLPAPLMALQPNYGHAAGDALGRYVANLLRNARRAG